MKWFNYSTTEKVKHLLKKSQADFKFDKESVKNHLMLSVESYKQKPGIVLPKRRSRVPVWGRVLAGIVLFGSSATLALADSAKPGDTLFFLDRLQEKAVLTLPLPSEQKASLQTRIVTERVNELQKLKATANQNEVKVKAIEESEISVTKAFENVTEVKLKLEKRGKTEQAERFDEILNKLDNLAERNEKEIEGIKKGWRENIKEDKNKERNIERANKSLKEIQRARRNLRLNSSPNERINDRSDSTDESLLDGFRNSNE